MPYLGSLLRGNQMLPDSKKVEVVRKCPPPKKLTELRRFLGLTGYYRKFIKEYADIAERLTRLLKKEEPNHWGPDQ